MPNHCSPRPENIARSKYFTDGEVRFYSRLYPLMEKDGYCSYSNKVLSVCVEKSPRQIRRYLKKFSDSGVIIVDIEDGWNRKIWNIESWEAFE